MPDHNFQPMRHLTAPWQSVQLRQCGKQAGYRQELALGARSFYLQDFLTAVVTAKRAYRVGRHRLAAPRTRYQMHAQVVQMRASFALSRTRNLLLWLCAHCHLTNIMRSSSRRSLLPHFLQHILQWRQSHVRRLIHTPTKTIIPIAAALRTYTEAIRLAPGHKRLADLYVLSNRLAEV